MNLIEQLGGYECAKAEYDDPMYEDGELYTIKATGARFFKHNLADELLDYRRQHNIYEVGDKVVSTLDGDEFWMHFVCTIDGFHKKMIITNGGGHIIHHYEFRHATPAEIAAGRRL